MDGVQFCGHLVNVSWDGDYYTEKIAKEKVEYQFGQPGKGFTPDEVVQQIEKGGFRRDGLTRSGNRYVGHVEPTISGSRLSSEEQVEKRLDVECIDRSVAVHVGAADVASRKAALVFERIEQRDQKRLDVQSVDAVVAIRIAG